MKNPWFLALISGLWFAMVSICVIFIGVHFPPPYKDIFEICIVLSTIVVPHLLITKYHGKSIKFWKLAILGWASCVIYLVAIFIYFMLLETGSFSGNFMIVIIVFSVAFALSAASAAVFLRKF